MLKVLIFFSFLNRETKSKIISPQSSEAIGRNVSSSLLPNFGLFRPIIRALLKMGLQSLWTKIYNWIVINFLFSAFLANQIVFAF